jgi:hypothetical protein
MQSLNASLKNARYFTTARRQTSNKNAFGKRAWQTRSLRSMNANALKNQG